MKVERQTLQRAERKEERTSRKAKPGPRRKSWKRIAWSPTFLGPGRRISSPFTTEPDVYNTGEGGSRGGSTSIVRVYSYSESMRIALEAALQISVAPDSAQESSCWITKIQVIFR